MATSMLTDPVRFPQAASVPERTKRAFTLLALTLLVPGSAQTVAGDRALGRRALRITLAAWTGVIAMVLLGVFNRSMLINLVTDRWISLVLIVVLALLAIGWAFLFINTLRLIRPALLAPGMRPLVAGLLAVLMLGTSGSLGYGAYLLNVSRNTFGSIFQAGPSFDPVDGRYNFLLMGGDAGEDRIGRRPDSISVVSIDAKTGETTTFGIPRNFQNAPFPEDSPLHDVYPAGYNCGDECIINSLYTRVHEEHADLYPGSKDPGAEAMMDAASGVLGIEVQAYAIVDMGGFEQLIDAMGGITINAGGWVPISGATIEGTEEHLAPEGWIAPGTQRLDGFHALWYARSREFVTDYERIARQQCVQQAMIAQLDPATVLTRFEAIAKAGEQIVETNVPQSQLGGFVDLAVKAKGHETKTLTIGPPDFGEPQDNFVTYPDFDLIHQRVQQMLAPSDGGSSPAAAGPSGSAGTGHAALAVSAGPLPQLGLPQLGLPRLTAPEPADDGITEEYLQYLAEIGDAATLSTLVANNGQCTPG